MSDYAPISDSSAAATANPYVRTEATAMDPPTSLKGKLRYVGPGFILSASIVGSGELIMTTQLGAEAGFVTLWVVLVSCLVKVAVQLEFGKHAIYSGQTTFSAFNALPGPRLGRANWSIWSFLLLMTLKFVQVGGVMGALTLVMHLAFPIFGAEVSQASTLTWCVLSCLAVSLLVFRGKYQPVEKASLVMIALFTITTLASVVMLKDTIYAVTLPQIASGLTFDLPTAAVGAAIAAFGITGVGGDEIIMYNYWLLERGYAAKTGPRQPTAAWTNRARGWIRVMYLDAWMAMAGYTIVTAAFYVLGAAVLHGQGIIPQGNQLILTLSSMYTETLGPQARGVFLVGAFVVLFSTLLSALAGWTRLFADVFAQIGTLDFRDPATRSRLVAWLAWTIPAIWAALYLLIGSASMMVKLGGIATCGILIIVVYAAVHFRFKLLPPELKPGPLYNTAFWLSVASILLVGIYTVSKVF